MYRVRPHSCGLGGLLHQRLTSLLLSETWMRLSKTRISKTALPTDRADEIVVLADKLGHAWKDMSRHEKGRGRKNERCRKNFFCGEFLAALSRRFLQLKRSFVIYWGRSTSSCLVPTHPNFWHASLRLHACRGLGLLGGVAGGRTEKVSIGHGHCAGRFVRRVNLAHSDVVNDRA